MTLDEAELSSIATQIDELLVRVTDIAERLRDTDQDDVAVRLFEVERALLSATRSLATATRSYDR